MGRPVGSLDSHPRPQRANAYMAMREEDLVRMVLARVPLKECADRLGITIHAAKWTLRKPEVRAKVLEKNRELWEQLEPELQEAKRSLTEKLMDAADEVLEEMRTLALYGSTEIVRVKAGSDLLDRVSDTAKTSKKDVRVDDQHRFMNPLVLKAAARVAEEEDRFLQRSVDIPSATSPVLPPASASDPAQLSLFTTVPDEVKE